MTKNSCNSAVEIRWKIFAQKNGENPVNNRILTGG